jgi:tetrahydromethanopterin S-methyltransferase subunit G
VISSLLANWAIFGTFACGAAGFVGRKAWRGMRRWTRFLDDYEGIPDRDGVAGRPGVMKRLQTIESTVETVSEESRATRVEVQTALQEQERRQAAISADVDVRLADMAEKIEVVHSELTPNGGGSIKDQVTRTDKRLNPVTSKATRDEEPTE